MALWEGQLSRGRLMNVLGLSGIRVSQLIREVREETPYWFDWDNKTKSYYVTDAAYREMNAELKLGKSELSLAAYVTDAHIHTSKTQDACTVTAIPWTFSHESPRVFSRIRLAIEQGTRLELEYRSMQTPEPHQRNVEPHSLVRTGQRWHMRGYCIETNDFRDFVLGRITKISMLEQKAIRTPVEDIKWSTVVKVGIMAHPKLSLKQQDLVRYEYFDGTVARVHSCRGALLPYLIQELKLALDVSKELPPEYQMAVENVEEVRKWLFPS